MNKKKIISKKYRNIYIPTHAEQARDFFLNMIEKYTSKYATMILISARMQGKQMSFKMMMEEINKNKKTLKNNSIGSFFSHGGS